MVAHNAHELAKALGLTPADGMEIQFRSELNEKIIEVVAKKGLTHADALALHKKSQYRSSPCNLCVLCVSVVDEFRAKTTTETQRTLSFHGEILDQRLFVQGLPGRIGLSLSLTGRGGVGVRSVSGVPAL